jgi:hypothetical protein
LAAIINDSTQWLILRYLCDSIWDVIQSILSSDTDTDSFRTFPLLTPIRGMEHIFYLYT